LTTIADEFARRLSRSTTITAARRHGRCSASGQVRNHTLETEDNVMSAKINRTKRSEKGLMIGTIPLAAVLLVAISVPAFAADGAAVFKADCAGCHGETGHADTAIGKAMKVPQLAGDDRVQKMSSSDIVALIKSNPKHPPTVKGLSDDDLNPVAAHVQQLASGK
jgi:cytochrome c553